jgi:DNA mismatch repair ATPase MutS
MATNLFIHYRHKANVGYYTNMLSGLNKLHGVGTSVLKNVHYLTEEQKRSLKKDLNNIKSILKKVRFLKTEKLVKTGGWYLAEVGKFLTLLDVTTFESLIRSVKKEKASISAIYHMIGEADVALSVLALRQNLPFYCLPTFSSDPGLDVKSLYHPLLEEAIPNDLCLKDENLLITGSNMSGKSTFIKSLNLNAISAQVLNTAFASTYRSGTWRFATSINLEDDLESGSSYYLSEVDRIGEIIQYAKEEKPHLITIDEIFKGTNTIERVASAAAVLGYLAGTAALVIVSTHDLELAELLTSGFALYHFQEKVRDADLSFDYKIKPGVMTERNAIKVLSLAGYPPEVVEKAKNLAQIAYETTSTAPPTPPPSLT